MGTTIARATTTIITITIGGGGQEEEKEEEERFLLLFGDFFTSYSKLIYTVSSIIQNHS